MSYQVDPATGLVDYPLLSNTDRCINYRKDRMRYFLDQKCLFVVMNSFHNLIFEVQARIHVIGIIKHSEKSLMHVVHISWVYKI